MPANDDPDPHPQAPVTTAGTSTPASNGSATATTETTNGIDVGSPYFVLDGVQVILPELDAHRRKASNRELPLVERLEAYEDIGCNQEKTGRVYNLIEIIGFSLYRYPSS